MTAKHRKGKNNHKQEDNFFKNEVLDSEVRAAENNYIPLLGLFLLLVIGGAAGGWFCFQQQQTLTYLTDNLMGLQMKIVKLQSSHEELRRSNDKPSSDSVESRLVALEESYALARKQVGMALTTAEQLKTSDLPAQVLSLHTEMKSRLAELQHASVSVEQLGQLQGLLEGNGLELDGVRIQVDGLATLTAELSQKVDVLEDGVGEAESKLEERAGQVVTLTNTLNGQAGEVLHLREQLETYQLQLEAGMLDMAVVRELLEKEEIQRLQQVGVEQQLHTVRQSLQDQNAAAHNLHSELREQLESIQKQVTQLQGETLEEANEEEEEEEAAAVEEEVVPAEGEAAEMEVGSPAANEELVEGLPTAEEETDAVSPDGAPDAQEEEVAPSDEEEGEEMEREEPLSEMEESDRETEAQSVETESPITEEEEHLELEGEEDNLEVEEEMGSEAEEEEEQRDAAPEEEPQETDDDEEEKPVNEDDVSTQDKQGMSDEEEDAIHQEELSLRS